MPASSSGPLAFQRLCSLVGEWKDAERPVHVDYRMTAHNSVLVETWTWLETGIESLTLYHLDAGELMATHYCPVGNQPRLRLDSDVASPRLHFSFVSATNLPDSTVDHCVAFWIEHREDDTFLRTETYEENGERSGLTGTYLRRA